ncbi:MAG: hypothetical protein EZS26_000764 [Candidatus Ordinivivax streblomastigis]|uniref:Uncharacterized protein n=1 Tax=Candidatus Ordinivivax streblomastigis TaxID=2540710 RepID=A0A5M8P431_9BACT|nr:MAG: hypothetical protein EZS26_000764 [Candidatus Ordinivivax streblomastigis]
MNKKNSIFAPSSPKTNLHSMSCGSHFFGYFGANIYTDIRLSIHNGLPHSCCNLSLARCGAIAFLILFTLIFCYMPKTTKDASKANNSSRTSTSIGTKTELFKKFLIEKNAKNTAYGFILSSGLYSHFVDFCNNSQSSNPHTDCLAILFQKGGMV